MRSLAGPVGFVVGVSTFLVIYETCREVDTPLREQRLLTASHLVMLWCHFALQVDEVARSIHTGSLTSIFLCPMQAQHPFDNPSFNLRPSLCQIAYAQRKALQNQYLPPWCISLVVESSEPFNLTSFALSLLLVFRTNASYARWVDARKLWGGVVNRSRDVTRQV